jgi:hypothetical protein
VNTFRRIIVYILLITLLIWNIRAFEYEDEEIYHSLSELPSLRESPYPVEHTIALPENSFTDNEISTLLAAKKSFEISETLLAPPVLSVLPNGMNLLEEHMAFSLSKDREQIATKIPRQSAKQIITDQKTRLQWAFYSGKTHISVDLKVGTEIRDKDNTLLDSEDITLSEAWEATKLLGKSFHKKQKTGNKRKWQSEADPIVFEFGTQEKHLIFSKPLLITIDTPGMTDGTEMEIWVLHAGDTKFGTLGLSLSEETQCQNDGSASISGNIAYVKSGKVQFYTCGASSFTMNPTGGYTGSNDIRLIIGDCGQFQLYYNSGSNIYTWNPPATGCNNTLDSWIALRIGATTYGSDWTAWTTNTTTGTTNGNTYTWRTTLTRLVTGLTYTLTLDWKYTAPNKFFTIDWSVNIPLTNTNNVRFYIANDSTVWWADANDVWYTGSTPSRTVWVFDNVLNQLSAIRYLSGIMWTAEQANPFGTVRTQITNGVDFTNAIQTTAGDLGFWVNWNLGITPGTYTGSLEWRMLPYVTGSVVDLVPGIGQPEWPLTVNFLSQIPITITNAGSLASSGVHQVRLTIPTNITGPSGSFTDNGWSCGAQVGTGVTCTKTTNISPLGNDILRIPVTPTLAASGSSVTFTGTISNSGDLITSNNSAFATNAVVGGSISANPGWVASPGLWLRAWNGTNCTTSGCTITTWTNSGIIGTPANATTGSWNVLLSLATLVNGNPTLLFQNASLNLGNNLAITNTFSIFTITRIAPNGKFPIWTQTWVTNALEWLTTPTFDTFKFWAGATSYSGANARVANIAALTSSLRSSTGAAQGRTNGLINLNGTLATAITSSNIRLGGTATSSGSNAHLAEVIIYNSILTGSNLNKVESYLATKYGITLNQSNLTNYTLSNNSIWYNAALMSPYTNNIAGIARDDTSTLDQKTSQSLTNTWDISVSVASIGTNFSALYWANNGGATGSLVTTDIATGSTRITREWRFEENITNLGTVTVSHPAASLPAGFSGTLMLFVDSDGVFASGATSVTGTYNTGALRWDFSLDIADGEYITFGTSPSSDITPPTLLTNSLQSGALLPIGNFLLTLTYADTGSLINTGSFTGAIYSWNTGSLSWNTTNLAPTYMSISGVTSTSTGRLQITNLPYGKYRYDIGIRDNAGNTTTGSYTYFVDDVSWSVNTDNYNIWDIIGNMTKFGTGELIITIQTVWAGFSISTLASLPLVWSATPPINYWNGSAGWGYDLWNGFTYSNSITSHSPSVLLWTQAQNINQNGEKNTYTYRLKYWALVDSLQDAGNYNAQVSFRLDLSY